LQYFNNEILAVPVTIGDHAYILPSDKVFLNGDIASSNKYMAILKASSLADAQKLCEKRQMDLLKIETKDEQGLIGNFLSSKCTNIILYVLK
jgi:hypothetical protein